MITSWTQLRNCLKVEKTLYTPLKKRDAILAYVCHDLSYLIWKYVKVLRMSEYHLNNSSFKSNNPLSLYHDFAYVMCRIIRNKRGERLGIEIYENNFEEGLLIYHGIGGILLNGKARIGKNCKLHGNNCIGNKGISEEAPVIGDNVDIGFGASVFGNVVLGNNIIIAAGAVVVSSFPEGDCLLGGVPAQIIKRHIMKNKSNTGESDPDYQ